MPDEVLSRGSLSWYTDDNFTSVCPNGTEWIWVSLGECTQDGRDMASVTLGLISILCFIVASLPQYYKSCITGNMDSALSIWFLLLWLAGDTCNLIGSFLANQLPLQTYTAVYYVLADILMLAMYTYYMSKNKRRQNRNLVLNVAGIACVLGVSVSVLSYPGSTDQREPIPLSFASRALLSVSETAASAQGFTTKEIVGFTIGSLSSVLYLSSRLPQMYTNYKRKSTEGVSYFLFALVMLGNSTYGVSVLVKNPERGQGESSYVIHHLPWLIGSLGTLLLDVLISLQFLAYRNPPQEADKHEETAALLDN